MNELKSKMRALLCVVLIASTNAQFDFGTNGGACSGSGEFRQQIAQDARLVVGDIPSGLEGLEIAMITTGDDVDIQLTSGETEVINWEGDIINEGSVVTKTWSNDAITYSGYGGDGINAGNEYVMFKDGTSNAYRMWAYGYQPGVAVVTYSWTGQTGCTGEGGGPDPFGKGNFRQVIEDGAVVVVGDLPAGLTDVYVRLDSEADIDIQLYDGDVAVVDWVGGLINGSRFERKSYGDLQIQYSGYSGEQRPDAKGQEYVLIEGVLPRTFSLRVLGYQAGFAEVTYSWGYYHRATSTNGAMLKDELHEIIDEHTELTYTPGCWDALKRTDQDNDDSANVILFYSRRSHRKDDQDNGRNGQDAWNREHIYAKSHGNFGTSRGPGTDIHALRAADKSVNTERSAKDFAYGGSELSSADPREDCPLCRETSTTFEPPDEIKGDVARMLFYMAVRYNGDDNSNEVTLNVVDGVGTEFGASTTDFGEIGDLATLILWHNLDPVSDEERHRNNIIYDIQGNRNPFIDKPQFVETVLQVGIF